MSELDEEELKATRELNKNKYKNVDIFGAKNKDNDETLKIHIPLLTKEEKREIENNLESIVDKYIHTIVHEKDLAASQHITIKQEERIKQLEKDIEKKDKIIDEMVNGFFKLYQERPGTMHKFFENGKQCKFGYIENDNECREINCKPCIKQYFERKVEEDVK